MKQVIILEDSDKYIEDLEKKNESFIYADAMPEKELYSMLKSKTLEEDILVIFDLSLIKLSKSYIDNIIRTTHNILILADGCKKIPKSVLDVCEIEYIDKNTEETTPIKTLGKLGKIDVDIENIKKFPLGYLIKYLNVNWDKFENKHMVYNILVEMNKRLYKVNNDYLQLYLMWNFPKQKRKTFFRYPTRKKFMDRDTIINKVGDYYGFSYKEVMKSWWLIRKIMNNDMADKFGLTAGERSMFGIKVEKKEEKEVNKSKSLLEL